MSSRRITHAIIIIASGTVIVRVFGLFREVFNANFFGTTFIYDAFLLAFMIPNFFRGILAEGALSTAFIPVLSEYTFHENQKSEVKRIANISFTLSLIITLLLSILVFFLSSVLMSFFPSSSKWFWVFSLLRFTFPYLIFMSLAAVNMGILNTYKHFLAPTYAPIALDLFWILSLFLICPLFGNSLDRRIFGLCIGLLLGGAGQFLFQLPPVRNRGISYKLDFNFRHPAIRKMGKLLAPVVIGVAVAPINLLVDYSLANFLAPGMVSALWYATRIFQLPLGIFAISISTAVLPWFSEQISKGKRQQFLDSFYHTFRILILLLVPSTVGLIILRQPVISLLFERGVFDTNSVSLTAWPLALYTIGLLGYGGASITTRAFYAFRDTKTPVKIGIFSIAVNLILDIILMQFMQHAGIALSTSIVGWTNFCLLIAYLNIRHIKISFKKIFTFFTLTLIPSALMGIILYMFRAKFMPVLPLPIFLSISIMLAVAVYFTFLKLCTVHNK